MINEIRQEINLSPELEKKIKMGNTILMCQSKVAERSFNEARTY